MISVRVWVAREDSVITRGDGGVVTRRDGIAITRGEMVMHSEEGITMLIKGRW